MKTPSDKLHRLIRALTPTEKRYFRLFVRSRSERDSKYLYLFDLLDRAKVEDDAYLRKKIYKSQVVKGKKFTELKGYLYDLILKCLQSYEEEHALSHRLNHLMQSATVLFNRGLYDDCRDMLHKATKLASHYEVFSVLLEIAQWEKRLAYTKMDVDFLDRHLERIQYEEERIEQQLHRLIQYRRGFFQVYTAIKRDAQHRDSGRMAQLRTIVQQDIFTNPDLADSHMARIFRYRTLNLYHYAARENEQFYETGKQLVALLESQPHFLREDLSDYIAALSNLILSCGLTERLDEVRTCLAKMRGLKAKSIDDRQKIHRQYYSNLFALCTYTGEFEEAHKEMEACRKEAAMFDSTDYETSSFVYQYCFIAFGCGDYDAALGYLNQWLSMPRSVERQDLQSLARILSLILHFEMGNLILLESLLRSTARFLQTHNRYHSLEQRFVHGIGEAIRAQDAQERQAAFLRLKTDLNAPDVASAAQALLQTFDLNAWLESKVSARSFAACVKLKAANSA
jgi:hypothetical protein